jgi:iron complex outermembrane receptor protein
VGGLADGARLPTAPKFQGVASAGYTMPVWEGRALFANLTVQYVGSSFSQFENEEDGFGSIGGTAANAARLIRYGGPLTVTQITFNPELPGYTLANFRLGVKGDHWELAGYVNNLTDKTARLALDYERGRSARVGYLTNQPRSYGLYGMWSF